MAVESHHATIRRMARAVKEGRPYAPLYVTSTRGLHAFRTNGAVVHVVRLPHHPGLAARVSQTCDTVTDVEAFLRDLATEAGPSLCASESPDLWAVEAAAPRTMEVHSHTASEWELMLTARAEDFAQLLREWDREERELKAAIRACGTSVRRTDERRAAEAAWRAHGLRPTPCVCLPVGDGRMAGFSIALLRAAIAHTYEARRRSATYHRSHGGYVQVGVTGPFTLARIAAGGADLARLSEAEASALVMPLHLDSGGAAW